MRQILSIVANERYFCFYFIENNPSYIDCNCTARGHALNDDFPRTTEISISFGQFETIIALWTTLAAD